METNKKLNLQDVIDALASNEKITKEEADVFLKELFAIIPEVLSEDDPLKIKDFGAFKLTLIQARESVDVNTGDKIEIPAHYRFTFQPATALKELVNKPFSHFEATLINDGFNVEGIPSDDENEDENDDNNAIFIIKPPKNNEENMNEIESEKEVIVKTQKTGYPAFNKRKNPENRASNITERIFPEKRIRVVRESQKQPFGGIWGILGIAAAVVGVVLLFKGKKP